MLTPVEMQGRELKTGRGYQKKETDEFLHEIFQDYESLYRENMELKDKVNVLSDGLQYYKDLEKTLQKTLVVAEKAAEETTKVSQKRAEGIEQKARITAQAMVNEAQREAEKIYQSIKSLSQQYESYRIQCKQLACAQLEMLDSNAFKIDMDIMPLSYLEPESVKEKEEEPPVRIENLPVQEQRKPMEPAEKGMLQEESAAVREEPGLSEELLQQDHSRKEKEQLERLRKEQLEKEEEEIQKQEKLRQELYEQRKRREQLTKQQKEKDAQHRDSLDEPVKEAASGEKTSSRDILWDEEESYDSDLFEFLNLNDEE